MQHMEFWFVSIKIRISTRRRVCFGGRGRDLKTFNISSLARWKLVVDSFLHMYLNNVRVSLTEL